MKAKRLILWIFTLGAAAMVVAAVWVLFSSLETRGPELSTLEVKEYKREVSETTKQVLGERKKALEDVSKGWFRMGRVGEMSLQGVSVGFNEAKKRSEGILSEVEGERGLDLSKENLVWEWWVDDALDEADRLYKERINEETETGVEVYRGSMRDEAEKYFESICFKGLADTVQRDVMAYRSLSSLVFQELKMKLYTERSKEAREEVERRRDEARSSLEDIRGELDVYYETLLKELAGKELEGWENGEEVHVWEFREDAVRLIRGWMEKFGMPEVRLGGIAVGEMPDTQEGGWVESEREETEKFERSL